MIYFVCYTRRSVAARTLAVVVALATWLSPLQLSLQQVRQAAGVLAAGAVAVDTPAVLAGAARQGWMRWAVNHLPVTFSFGLPAAPGASHFTAVRGHANTRSLQ